MRLIKVLTFKTETSRCLVCGAWNREIVDMANSWDLSCCHISTTKPREGRPIGPRSWRWKRACELFGVDPETGICCLDWCKDEELNEPLDTWCTWREEE